MFTPLKLATIFNSITNVSIFSINLPQSFKFFFNSDTFDFLFSQNVLNSDFREPSTLIPTKLGKFFFFFFFLLISTSLNSSEKISLAGSMVLEKRVRWISTNLRDSGQFFRFRRIPARFCQNHYWWFAKITIEGILGKTNHYWGHFGKKKNAWIERNWNFRGVNWENWNFGSRIKNRW